MARRPAVLVGGVGALGVGQLLPVVQCPEEVLEAHGGGLGDQHRLVAGHGGLGAVAPGRGDGPGLVGPDPALPPGLGAVGQVAQRPAEADPAPGGAAGTRQRVATHAEAVLAPSAAHSSPASKAAVASVTKASKRASPWWSTSIDAPSP